MVWSDGFVASKLPKKTYSIFVLFGFEEYTMLKLIDNLLIQQILAGKSPWEEWMLKFVKQIEVNLSICPKKTEGIKNRIGFLG